MKLPFARALIIDDERHAQMRVQFALEQVGFQCDVAADGIEARQKMVEGQYHAVVTELVLPNTNGGELVINICKQECRPLVIVHTRVLEQEVYQGLKNEGVDAIFYKPADYSVMARNIQSMVAGHLSPEGGSSRWKNWAQASSHATRNEVVRMLRHGDGWIQDSSVRIEAFRFTIVILACVLFGMGWGNTLDPNMAGICKMFGLCGFAFYFCLELVAYYRDQHRTKLIRWSAERRLDEQVENQPEMIAVERRVPTERMTQSAPLVITGESRSFVTSGAFGPSR